MSVVFTGNTIQQSNNTSGNYTTTTSPNSTWTSYPRTVGNLTTSCIGYNNYYIEVSKVILTFDKEEILKKLDMLDPEELEVFLKHLKNIELIVQEKLIEKV